MANKLNTKNVIFVNGRTGDSYLIARKQAVYTIEDYRALFVPEEGCEFTVTTGSEDSFCIVSHKGKVSTVMLVKTEKEDILDDGSFNAFLKEAKDFHGKVIVYFRCKNEPMGVHLVFVDTTNGVYKNVSIDVFGYEGDELGDFFNTIFCTMPFKSIKKVIEKQYVDSLTKMLDGPTVTEQRNDKLI